MTETKRQIKELKAALPHVREKVIAVATMLALSLTMMASVSYAWYTMSTAPEAKSITTRVSSNGNLEVALAGLYDDDGKLIAPLSTAVGDSFSADGKEMVDANLTWGNLINLSTNYGIENLILRPATYSETASSFLSSKIYGEDGRVVGTSTDFDFTSWMEVGDENKYYTFAYTQQKRYGVRAISSVTYPDGKGETEAMITKLSLMHGEIADKYEEIYQNPDYIATIQEVVQLYLDATIDAKLNKGNMNNFDFSEQVPGLSLMLNDFYDNVIVPYGDVLAYMANVQKGTTEYTPETMYDSGAVINELLTYKELLKKVEAAKETLSTYAEKAEAGEVVTWGKIQASVDALIGITDATIELSGEEYTITSLSTMGMGTLATLVMGMPEKPTEIPISLYSGAFHSFETLCGDKYMSVKIDFKIDATVEYQGLSVPVKKTCVGRIQTDARNYASIYSQDYAYTVNNAGEFKSSNKIAADTYGLVIDLWVRTNAADSILTLDGLAEYDEFDVPYEKKVNIVDSEGNVVTVSKKVWYYTVGDVEYEVYADTFVDAEDLNNNGNTTEEITVYKSFGTDLIAYIEETQKDETTGEETTTSRLVSASDVKPKTYRDHTVTGFQSSNRIEDQYDVFWSDEGYASATQGSGSCYIFYSSNPEEADSILKLLEHMKMTFVDANGTELAYALMQVDYAYNDNGKYIVPIVIDDTKPHATYSVMNDKGEVVQTIHGITKLEKNEATMISMVLYLDGSGLDNTMIMSNDSITGSLNLQFASTDNLESLFNTELSNQYISLSANINDGLNASLEYDGGVQTLKLTAQVKGVVPNTVQAAFRRQINSSQGSVQQRVELTLNEQTGLYECDYPFTVPGNYVLNSLWVDGVEYELDSELTVTVNGFTVDSVKMDGDTFAYTADNYTTRNVRIRFNENQDPGSVYVKFLSEDGIYATGKLTYSESGEWTGTVRFDTSGKYTLTYLVLDNEYYDVPETLQRQLTVYLGLYSKVTLEYTYAAVDEDGNPVLDEEGNPVTITSTYAQRDLSFVYDQPVNISVMVDVYSNTDELMTDLGKIKLTYLNEKYASAEYGLESELAWDGSSYSGIFQLKNAGVYNFAYVSVGSEYITKATQAPAIKASYPDPPTYSGSVTDEVIVTGGGTAYYEAMIAYGPAMADTYVMFRDENGEQYSVPATVLENNVYKFEFPYYDSNSATPTNQNGVWTVVGFYFNDVYEEGKHYFYDKDTGEGQYYYINFADNKYETYYVLDQIDIDATSGELSGSFMEELEVSSSGIEFNLSAANIGFEKIQISSVSVELTHNLGTNAGNLGGYTYTRSDATYDLENRTLSLTGEATGGTWTVSSGTVLLAGTYNYDIYIGLSNGTTYNLSGKDLLTVSSVIPSVSITNIAGDNSSNTSTTTSATVYNKSTVQGLFTKYTIYSEGPRVYITLANSGYASGATLTFYNNNTTTATTKLYTDWDTSIEYGMQTEGSTSSYTWGGSNTVKNGCDGEIERYVGYVGSGYYMVGLNKSGAVSVAGTIKAEQLELVCNGITFYVDCDIIINNPS